MAAEGTGRSRASGALAAMAARLSGVRERSVEELPEPLALVAGRWEALRGEAPMPRADRMELAMLGPGAAFAAIVDLEEGPALAWYRAAGPALVRLWGRNPSGLMVRDLYRGGVLRDVMDVYGRVRDRAEPIAEERSFRLFNRSYGYVRLILPLADSDGRVARAILVLCPADPALVEAHQWRVPAEEWDMLDEAEKRGIEV